MRNAVRGAARPKPAHWQERVDPAAKTHVQASQTGRPLRILPDDLAEHTARQLEAYPGQAERHFAELMAILDEEGDRYAS